MSINNIFSINSNKDFCNLKHATDHTNPNSRSESKHCFLQKLGFEIQTQGSKIVAIDSQTCIEINPERTARVCIQLYQSRWDKTLLQLKDRTPIIKTEEGYLITDPNGVWIKLIEKTLDEKTIRSNRKKAALETTEASA